MERQNSAPSPVSKRSNDLVHEVFEEQVERTPDAVAVTCEGCSVTFAELNGQANQLAHYLIGKGVQIGDYVPVVMSRSIDMLIAQLAVLKTGGVYVPVDPNLPLERQLFIIRDCGARHGLAHEIPLADPGPNSVEWIVCTAPEIRSCSKDNVRCPLLSPHPAYVMYTSGSTGMPKGVIVPHHAIRRLVFDNGYAQIDTSDCIAHTSNPAFDASTFEIWAALLTGARLAIIPQATLLNVDHLIATLQQERVTIAFITIGLLKQHVEALSEISDQFKYLITGGDVVDAAVVRRLLAKSPPRHFLNAYGPTECTTFATTHEVTPIPEDAVSLPIGRPISNTTVHILDSHLQPVANEVPGEIYIGGAGVALGYLNRPELTAERFLADPFSATPHARMYRTGDLGRRCADGAIDFLGRVDTQVKIRGFRVEPGEIEAQVMRHERVRQTVVLAREDVPGDKRLVAYVIPKGPPVADEATSIAESLRRQLSTVLPQYMVPSAFVLLDEFPLTPNGKLDRRAFPPPSQGSYVNRPYEVPQGDAEEMLAGIWQTLLQVQRIGRQDNFFQLGGHSLLIVSMLDRLRRIGFSVEAQRVYTYPTLADLAGQLMRQPLAQLQVPPNLIPPDCEEITPKMLPLLKLTADEIQTIAKAVPEGPANIQDIYPLGPLQEGILFHHLWETNGADTYVVPILLSVASRERLEELIAALQFIIDRHDVLRTAVAWEHLSQPVQVVYRRATLPIEEVAIDRARNAMDQLKDRMRPERQWLNLRKAPLMRLQIAGTASGSQWHAILQVHHLVCDHVSMDKMLAELGECLSGRASDLPNPVPYRNHIAQSLAHARTHDAKAFFQKKLGDVEEPTLPFGLSNVHGNGSTIDKARRPVDAELGQRIRAQARRLSVTAATLFHAAWALVVSRTSGRDDIVYGTLLLGRLYGSAGAERVLGMFINTLPLRLRLKDVTAIGLVHQTQQCLFELVTYEQASLAVAQRCTSIPGAKPLFSTLLNYRHSVDNPETQQHTIAEGVEVTASQEWTNYPITIAVDDRADGFELDIKTDRRIHPRRIADYMITAIDSLVDALEETPETLALRLPIIPETERADLLERFNATARSYPKDRLIHELFEEQVKRTPDATAAICRDRSLTYAQLNGRANQLARHLRAKGVGPDQLVALFVERGLEMLVGLLGVLKTGGAYVPLDPRNPTERLQHLLSDAIPRLVLTQERLQTALPRTTAESILLDTGWAEMSSYSEDDLNPRSVGVTPQSLAYVIYTSGSTGKPKGVMIEHRNIVNYAVHALHQFDVAAGNGSLLCTSISFDLALTGLYPTLLSGQPVRLCPDEQGAANLSDELLRCGNLAPLKLTPSHLAMLEHPLRTGQLTERIRVLVLGGEPLPRDAVEIWKHYAPTTRLFNHYGPTETTVGCVVHEISELGSGVVPIGRPISNTQIYILDAYLQPVPIGVIGEIYIAGAGVGRGYLNRPELTAERFLKNPFSADPADRMYRTGDLGRWLADGHIECLGRNDDQIKIHGMRIELGEIEAHLIRHEQLNQAVVVVREDAPGDKRLVAYLVLKTGTDVQTTPTSESLRAYLRAKLADYVVPSAFVFLPSFPLTANGKLDRRALPAPDAVAHCSVDYARPEGEVEETIADAWQTLLRIDRVGRHDNFFDLGGHSLLATRVISCLREALQTDIHLRDMFDAPTVEQLALRVSGAANGLSRGARPHSDGRPQDDRDEIAAMNDADILAEIEQLQRDLSDPPHADSARLNQSLRQ